MVATAQLRLVLSLLSVLAVLAAVGVVSPSQIASPLSVKAPVRVSGANLQGAESALWVFNPDMNMVHFELTLSNVSNYSVSVYVPSSLRFRDATKDYEIQPFSMRFDLSNLKTAVPMERASLSNRVYDYVFSDCTKEVDPNPQDVITYLANVLSPGSLIGGILGVNLQDIVNAAEYRRVLKESWDNCKDFYASKYSSDRVYVFLGVQKVKRPVVIPFLNIQVASYDFPKPDIFAVVEIPRETYVPRTVGQVYPVGYVRFVLQGRGGVFTYTVPINLTDINEQEITKTAEGPFGKVFFSFYAFSSGDLFRDRGDPQLFKWTDDYRIIYANDRSRLDDLRVSLLRYLSSDLKARDLYLGRLSDVQSVGWRLFTTFQGAVDLTNEVKSNLINQINNYRSFLESHSQPLKSSGASFQDYVLVLPDNPVQSHFMKLRFVGDLKARYLGLRYIVVSPKISNLKVVSEPTGTQPLRVEVSVRNRTDKRGPVTAYLSCSRLGTAVDSFDLPAGGTVDRTLVLYARNLDQPFRDSCVVKVCNVDGSVCDSRSLNVQYTPIQRCDPSTSWCSADGNYVEFCKDPYKGTVEKVACQPGQTCVVEGGQAKCVARPARPLKEENAPQLNCTCKQNGLFCYNPQKKGFEYRPCPGGSTCVVSTSGAYCKRQTVVSVPPKPEVVEVSPVHRDLGLRFGFAALGLGLAILAVVL